MKPKASFLLSLVLLLGLSVATTSSVAQDCRPSRPAPTARLEKQAYQKAQVQPVLRQQRLKLEAQLAPADRTQLAAYRAQLKALREQRDALRKSIAPAAPAGTRPAFTEAQMQQRQQLYAQTKTVMQAVAAMARQYQPTIMELAQEVQPQQEKWAADLRAIAFKYATPEQQQRMAARKPHHSPSSRLFNPTPFLLMEVSAPAVAIAERNAANSSFYPNPVTATGQLDFHVKEAGPVTVELLDARGNQLRTLATALNADKGLRTQQLDFRDLPAGMYFYKITTKGSSETKRFVKE